MAQIKRTIKYESDRVPGFGEEVAKVPGCEKLRDCIQCGTCSGVCPLSIYMDYSPRQIIALTRADFKNEVLSSFTIWLCASCYACTVECPQQIRITDIMYELKQRAIQEKRYPKRFPIPTLAEEFTKMVRKNGRISEARLVTTLFLKTDPLGALGMSKLGLGLIKTGRFSLKQEQIQNLSQLEKIMQTVEECHRQIHKELESPSEAEKRSEEAKKEAGCRDCNS